ncbi:MULTISPECIES: hypothetical protein [unclassified Xanthobacter]|nr:MULTISPECIES: hypothetical protein [unclassified Xanthobacter]
MEWTMSRSWTRPSEKEHAALVEGYSRLEEGQVNECGRRKPSCILRQNDLEALIYVPRWWRLDVDDPFRQRTGYLHVLRDGMSVLRCDAEALQRAPEALPDADAFVEYCDGWSSLESRMANVLCAGLRAGELKWMSPPWDYGSVVHLHSIVRAPGARPIAWKGLLDDFVRKLAGDATSMQILKAFPLEYEGDANRIKAEAARFERRRSALMRLYERMGFRACPEAWSGADEDVGWMWRASGRMPALVR